MGGFLSSIVSTMQNWNDNTVARLTGVRDRVARVRLAEDEGGMNLNMPATLIQKVAGRGALAAQELIKKFSGPPPSNGWDGWSFQRWVRLDVHLNALFQKTGGMRRALGPDLPWSKSYTQLTALGSTHSPPGHGAPLTSAQINALNSLISGLDGLAAGIQSNAPNYSFTPTPPAELRVGPPLWDCVKTHPQKAELSQPGGPKSKVLAFLNSNFGLFVLSSIFISSFTWAFNAYLDHNRKVKDEETNRQRLVLEIRNRMQFVDELGSPFPYDEWHSIQSAFDGFTPSANVNPSWIPHYSAVFPEFSQRSFISLIWELETISKSPLREQLRTARQPVETARTYMDKLVYGVVQGPSRNPDGKTEILALPAELRDHYKGDVLKPLAFLETITIDGSR
jgi:hypothetical protein